MFYWSSFNNSALIESISVKNKFKPFSFKDNIYLKLFRISLHTADGTLTTFPFIVCLFCIYFSNVGNAFWIKIASLFPAISLINIVLHSPYFLIFLSIIFWYFWILELKGINQRILPSCQLNLLIIIYKKNII